MPRRRLRAEPLGAGPVAGLADPPEGHSRKCRGRRGRWRRPRWCWSALPMPPTCRRPDEALRALRDGTRPAASPDARARRRLRRPSRRCGASRSRRQVEPRPRTEPRGAPPLLRLRRFEDVVALAGERRDIVFKAALERDVRLVRFEEGRIELRWRRAAAAPLPTTSRGLCRPGPGGAGSSRCPPSPARRPCTNRPRRRRGSARRTPRAIPLVQAVLSSFPGARSSTSSTAPPARATTPKRPVRRGRAPIRAELEPDDDL